MSNPPSSIQNVHTDLDRSSPGIASRQLSRNYFRKPFLMPHCLQQASRLCELDLSILMSGLDAPLKVFHLVDVQREQILILPLPGDIKFSQAVKVARGGRFSVHGEGEGKKRGRDAIRGLLGNDKPEGGAGCRQFVRGGPPFKGGINSHQGAMAMLISMAYTFRPQKEGGYRMMARAPSCISTTWAK